MASNEMLLNPPCILEGERGEISRGGGVNPILVSLQVGHINVRFICHYKQIT